MIPGKYPNGYSQILSVSRFSLPLSLVARRPPPPSRHPRSSSRFSSLSLSSLAALLLLHAIIDLPHASPPSLCHRSSKSPDDSAISIANVIRHHETEYMASLKASYSNLPDTTFKDLRRKLPVTRSLFPWHNTLQFSLTKDIQRELGIDK